MQSSWAMKHRINCLGWPSQYSMAASCKATADYSWLPTDLCPAKLATACCCSGVWTGQVAISLTNLIVG